MPEIAQRYKLLLDDNEYTVPANWVGFTPTTERHSVYRTLLSTFSENKVVLVQDAKAYVDSVYDLEGVAASVEVKWQEYNYETDSFDTTYNLGQLSFKPGHYKRMRDRSECGFEPVSFVTDLLNRDEIITDLQNLTDMNGEAITSFGSEYKTIQLDQQTVTRRFETEISEDLTEFESYTIVVEEDKYAQIGADQVLKNEPDFPEIDWMLRDTLGDIEAQITAEDDRVYDVELDYNVRFLYGLTRGEGISTVNANIEIEVRLVRRIDHADSTFEYVFIETASETFNGAITGASPYESDQRLSGLHSEQLTLTEGDAVKYYVQFNVTGTVDQPVNRTYTITPTRLDISCAEVIVNPATDCNVMLPWEFLLRLCQKITGRNDCLRSTFFGRTDGEVYQYDEDGDGSMFAITNVLQIRQFPISNHPINASLMQAFKGLNSLFMLGLGIKYEAGVPYIEIEPLSHWYDKDTTVMSLTAEEGGINWEPSIEYLWGSVKSGYPNYKNEDNWTLQSPHTVREYSITGLSEKINRVYDVRCDFITSGYLIEILRNNQYKKGTNKDNNLDNKLAIIHVKRDGSGGFTRVKDENFNHIQNLDNSDTQYNLELTPARTTLNHAPLILAGLSQKIIADPSLEDYLRYQSGEGNTQVNTAKPGESRFIEEGSDLIRSMIPEDKQLPLFNACFKGSCTVKLDRDQRGAFRDGFTGYVEITDENGTYPCFIEAKKDVDLINAKAELTVYRSLPITQVDVDQGNFILTEDGNPTAIEGEGGGFGFELEG